jgi:hypothetical protein
MSADVGGDALTGLAGGLAPNRYDVVDGRIACVRRGRAGNEVTEPLANFVARIDEEITRDDGAEVSREFAIGGQLDTGAALPRARVTAREFGGLGWVCRAWGAGAVVSAGAGTKDHLRAAIQRLSTPTTRTIFRHTGWRKVGGRWLFLYQGGAVGSDGARVEVELDPPLDRFALPAAVEDVRDAVGWSLRLLDCGPASVMLPLLASVYLAPLSSILEPDFTLWIHGETGSMKSELATLAQRHFGTFTRKSLPCSWTGTETSIEHRLFSLKDVLVVIDDFAPQADARAAAEQARRAERILRGVGNRSGRSRMRSDLTGRPDRPPRGLPVSTGELLPIGRSIGARTIPVEIDRAVLDIGAMTALQQNGHRLAHAMRGYIEWLARAPRIAGSLPAARANARRHFEVEGSHLRQPEALASLYVGLDLFLRYAEEVGAMDDSRAGQLRDEALSTFGGIASRLRERQEETDPAVRFVDALGALLQERSVRLLDKDSDLPLADDLRVVGWLSGDRVLLLPGAAYRCVVGFLRDRGEQWNPGVRDLYQALRRKEYVVPIDGDRRDVQWRVGPSGDRVRGWPIMGGILPVGAVDSTAAGAGT